MEVLRPSLRNILSNMKTVVYDYSAAAKRKRGIKPYASAYCHSSNFMQFTTRNGAACERDIKAKNQVLFTVHYPPGCPGYNSAFSFTMDDLYDGIWVTELIAYNQLKKFEGSMQVVPKNIMLHPAEPIVDRIRVSKKRFSNTDQDMVFQYLAETEDLMHSANRSLVRSAAIGTIVIGDEIFCDNRGSEIIQEVSVLYIRLEVCAPSDDGFYRRYPMVDKVGAAGGEELLKRMRPELRERAGNLTVNASLFAKAKGSINGWRFVPGTYDAVMDGNVAATSIHELGAGHFSEASWLLENFEVASPFMGKIGKEFYNPCLNIIDTGDITVNGIKPIAYMKYDCEGVPAKTVHMIRDGKFDSYLHTKLTAGTLKRSDGGGRLTGNARISEITMEDEDGETRTVKPMSRMRNLIILPNKKPCSIDDLLHEVRGKGIYIKGSTYGHVDITESQGSVVFSEIYFVDKNCNLVPIRITNHHLSLAANVASYMTQISAVGDKTTMSSGSGWCGSESGLITNSGSGAAILVKGAGIEVHQDKKSVQKPLIPYHRRKR